LPPHIKFMQPVREGHLYYFHTNRIFKSVGWNFHSTGLQKVKRGAIMCVIWQQKLTAFYLKCKWFGLLWTQKWTCGWEISWLAEHTISFSRRALLHGVTMNAWLLTSVLVFSYKMKIIPLVWSGSKSIWHTKTNTVIYYKL
jgi:hypothetical protein